MRGLYSVKANENEIDEFYQQIEYRFYAHVTKIQSGKHIDTKEFQAVSMKDGFNAVNAWVDQQYPSILDDDSYRIDISIYGM